MNFSNQFVNCKVTFIDNNNYIKINGFIPNKKNYKNVLLVAPNKIDKTSSYSGLGMPFPCADIAFENTKNIHMINSDKFETTFEYPNSYYTIINKSKVISSIFFVLEDYNGHKEFVRFELNDLYPLRSLINRESRKGPEFYSMKYDILGIDTSEKIMIEYAKIKILHSIA